MDSFQNFAKATVAEGNWDEGSTEIDLAAGHGARLPVTPFNAVWWNATDYPDPSDDPGVEIIRVTDIDTDTLTITRAQESTAAADHNLAGKTYHLMVAFTAKMLTDVIALVGDLFGSGPAIIFDLETPGTRWRWMDTDERYIHQSPTDIVVQSARLFMGDSQGFNNSGYIDVDDGNSRVVINNMDLATTQIESATGPVGTVVGKLAIRDGAGSIVGYLPIYNTIT